MNFKLPIEGSLKLARIDNMDKINELGILIMSDRDRLECDYLVRVRGAEAVKWAVTQLEGNRRPYISNIAKILKVEIPKDIPDPDKVLPIDKGLDMLSEVIKIKTRSKSS